MQVDLETTATKLEDLTNTAAADNLKLRDALRMRVEAENRIRAMYMVESSHHKTLKDTKEEVSRMNTCWD